MSDQKHPAGQSAGGWDNPFEPQPMKSDGAFVDQSERLVATIGSNFLQNYLSGGEVSKGIGILTQKRFYYKGKNFSGAGKETKSATEEGVVSIEDITFTKFTHFRHTGFLFFSVLLAFIGLIGVCVTVILSNDFLSIVSCSFLGAAIVFLLLYFLKRESLFLVAFPGGGFAFNIRWYPLADIRDFQRQLHLVKDHYKNG